MSNMKIKMPAMLESSTADGVLADAKQIKNGYIVVQGSDERDALKAAVITKGTPVYVVEKVDEDGKIHGKTYRWNGSEWKEETSSTNMGSGNDIYNPETEEIEEGLALAVEFTVTGSSVKFDSSLVVSGDKFTVDWGDETTDSQTSHTYADDGQHTIKLYSNMEELGRLPSTTTSATIGEKIKVLLGSAFNGCKNLTAVNLPYGLEEIGLYAFNGCKNLVDCIIPPTVKIINGAAFSGCNNLPSVLLGDNITSIGTGAFSECTALKGVTIGKNIETIDSFAFHECINLKSVEIPDSVKTIESRAFVDCSSMLNATIGASVESIKNYAFSGTALREIICKPLTPPKLGISAIPVSEVLRIIVPYGTVDAYKNAWTDYADYIYESGNYTYLHKITITDKTTSPYHLWCRGSVISSSPTPITSVDHLSPYSVISLQGADNGGYDLVGLAYAMYGVLYIHAMNNKTYQCKDSNITIEDKVERI